MEVGKGKGLEGAEGWRGADLYGVGVPVLVGVVAVGAVQAPPGMIRDVT